MSPPPPKFSLPILPGSVNGTTAYLPKIRALLHSPHPICQPDVLTLSPKHILSPALSPIPTTNILAQVTVIDHWTTAIISSLFFIHSWPLQSDHSQSYHQSSVKSYLFLSLSPYLPILTTYTQFKIPFRIASRLLILTLYPHPVLLP